MSGQAIAAGAITDSPGDGRFRSLDALRGIAAVLILLFHEQYVFRLGGWAPRFSFLVVDLFFCLSGFVIATNYDRRFAGGLTVVDFMRRRVRRLAPVYLLGWALSLATLLIPGARAGGNAGAVASTLAANLFLLPGILPVLFPLNPPSWSLFLELWVANLLYALVWRWLRPVVLGLSVVLSAVGLVFVAVHRHQGFDLGFFYGSLSGGLARVILSFFAGVAIARLHARWPATIRVPAIVLCTALIALVSLPIVGRAGTIYQLFCIAIGFPALIYLGASARERRPAIGIALGEASYALYAIHWPLLVFTAWGLKTGRIDVAAGLVLQLGLGAAIGLIAFGTHHAVDLSIRHRLPQRRSLA